MMSPPARPAQELDQYINMNNTFLQRLEGSSNKNMVNRQNQPDNLVDGQASHNVV